LSKNVKKILKERCEEERELSLDNYQLFPEFKKFM